MNTFTKIAAIGVVGVVMAGSVISPAYAWHPKGQITKSVQNITAGGADMAADTASDAVAAKPGDILMYTIEIKNVAAPADKRWNDLAFTVMTDTLPAGVELLSDPSARELKANIGTLLPGESATKKYEVKVTEPTDGKVIKNTACFTGDSVVKDNPQDGCDDANVTVDVPVVTEPPVTPPAPVVETPGAGTDVQPETLPEVGISATAPLFALATSVLGYFAYALRLKRNLA